MTSQALVTLSATDLRPDDTGEPRILDLDLGSRLGFDRPRVIRDLIRRNQSVLEGHGTLIEIEGTASEFAASAANPVGPAGSGRGSEFALLGANSRGPKRGPGRPGKGFLLNRDQALAVALLSRAPLASVIHDRLIQAFNAYREGMRAGPAVLSEAEKLPPLMVGMTAAVTVKVEIHDRAGLRNVQGRDLESPTTKAKLRKATVEVFLEMYTVRCSGMSITCKELMASWQEYRTENDLPRMEVRDLFRLVAEAGFEDDGESFHGVRYKMIPGVTPQLTQRRCHTGEPARLAALAAPSRPAMPSLTHCRGNA